jgi:hypothetical protein
MLTPMPPIALLAEVDMVLEMESPQMWRIRICDAGRRVRARGRRGYVSTEPEGNAKENKVECASGLTETVKPDVVVALVFVGVSKHDKHMVKVCVETVTFV